MANRIYEENQTIIIEAGVLPYNSSVPTYPSGKALLASSIEVAPSTSYHERSNLTGSAGAQGAISLNSTVDISFEIELAGIPDASARAYYSDTLLSCGLLRVSQATPFKTEFQPLAQLQDSGYINLMWRSGELQHEVRGIRGDIEIVLDTNSVPMIKFSGKGIYQKPVINATVISGIDFSSVQVPIPSLGETVTEMLFYGKEIALDKMTFKIGNNVVHSNLLNVNEVKLPKRKSSCSISFLTTDQEYVDFVDLAQASEYGAISYKLGSIVGRKFYMGGNRIQMTSAPKKSYQDGEAYLSCEFQFVPATPGSDFFFGWE